MFAWNAECLWGTRLFRFGKYWTNACQNTGTVGCAVTLKGFKGDDYFSEPNAKVNLINLAGTARTPAPTKKERKIKQCIARTN